MALIINGERIEDSAIQQEVERLRPDYERVFADQSPEKRQAQLLDWSRENAIETVLIHQEAKKHDNRIPVAEIEVAFEELMKQYEGQQLPEELDSRNDEAIKENIELELRIERMLRKICKNVPEPSKEVVLKYYEENKEQLRYPERARVSHIVKRINWQSDEAAAYDAMMRAWTELKNGAVFETLVAKYSDCPGNSGDLGYITRGQMVEEFEDVVFNLGIGQTSNIFRTRFGFHIARLYDRRPAVMPALEQVRHYIVSELKKRMHAKAIDEFIDRLKSKARIEEI